MRKGFLFIFFVSHAFSVFCVVCFLSSSPAPPAGQDGAPNEGAAARKAKTRAAEG